MGQCGELVWSELRLLSGRRRPVGAQELLPLRPHPPRHGSVSGRRLRHHEDAQPAGPPVTTGGAAAERQLAAAAVPPVPP